jgi:hypothetical protein
MKNLVRLCLPLVFVTLASWAHGQSSNVCGTTTVTPGGNFTWTSTFSVPIRVQPMSGEAWWIGQAYVEIPANGSVTISVPQTLPDNYSVDLQTTFETRAGGNPCGDTPGQPRIQNPN